MSGSSRRQIAILSLTLAVVMLGFGMVIPIFPFFIEELGGAGAEMGLLAATAALTELIFGPVWGSVSDRTGRKPVLVLGLFGYAISLVLFGLSTQLWMFFVTRALSGILSAATLSTAMAYIGDSTSDEDRGGGMGVLGAAMGLGVIAGPGLGGLLAGDALARPFFVGAGLSLVALLLVLLLLPESLPAEARRHLQVRGQQESPAEARRPPGGSGDRVGDMWRALFSPIGILLLMMFLVSFGLSNFEAVFGLYALEKFGYGPERVGVILMVVGIVTTAGKIFTGPLTRRWGDAAVIKASLLTGSLGFGVLLLANSYPSILLATGFFVLSKTFLRPAVLSLISKLTTMGQGVAMGLSNSFMSLGRIVGPIWAGFAFDLNVDYPYLSGSAILFVGFLIGLVGISQPGGVHSAEKQLATDPTASVE
jgi:DHA1 family multidrug resistance protein-like MFS transporter